MGNIVNGKSHGQHMGNRSIFRGLPFYSLCACGIGGISIDFDHFFSLVFNNPALWSIFHQPLTVYVLLGGLVSSLFGLGTALVLRKGDKNGKGNLR